MVRRFPFFNGGALAFSLFVYSTAQRHGADGRASDARVGSLSRGPPSGGRVCVEPLRSSLPLPSPLPVYTSTSNLGVLTAEMPSFLPLPPLALGRDRRAAVC